MRLPVQLPWYDTANPALDQMTPAEVQALQLERLQTMVHYVYHSSPFYRRKLDHAGVRPEDIRTLEDLRRLPFTTKQELQEDQAAHPPFGSYVCSHPSTWYRMFTTSGTTGRPLRRVLSYRDWELCIRWGIRRTADTGGVDKPVVAYLHQGEGFFGPTAGVEAAARRGAMILSLGRQSSEQKVQLLHELRPTNVSGTTSYLLYLGRLAEEMGMPFRNLTSLRSVTGGWDPGLVFEETRERIRSLWGDIAIFEAYGLTEICGLGGSCAYSPAIHICSDVAIVEVLDPETTEPVPPGEPGELVYTMLIGDTQPLLRYRSRDLGRLVPEPVCECGASHPRLALGIEGRVDDMIKYRGVNIFPAAVEQVVKSVPELGDEYQLVLRGSNLRPELVIRVEPQENGMLNEGFVPALAERFRQAIGVRVQVEIAPPGTLPRSDFKARRVVDERIQE